jgi:hypothetical protein
VVNLGKLCDPSDRRAGHTAWTPFLQGRHPQQAKRERNVKLLPSPRPGPRVRTALWPPTREARLRPLPSLLPPRTRLSSRPGSSESCQSLSAFSRRLVLARLGTRMEQLQVRARVLLSSIGVGARATARPPQHRL